MPQDDYEKHSQYSPKQYTGPAVPRGSSHIHALLGLDDRGPGLFEIGAEAYGGPYEIGADTDGDGFFEIGQSAYGTPTREEAHAYSRAFDMSPPRLVGDVKYYQKGKDLVTTAEVFVPASGTSILLSVKTPLAPIAKALKKALARGASMAETAALFGLDESDFLEIGWNPYSAAKKGVKSLGKTVKKTGKRLSKKVIESTIKSKAFKSAVKKSSALTKQVGRSAKQVAQNPYVQKFATGAAVAVGMYYGVPPNVTMAATGVLFGAINGDGVSVEKVANVVKLAAEGYAPAQKMKAVMTTLYKGGMKDMKPYLEQAQKVAMQNFSAKGAAIAQAALPTQFKLKGSAKYATMFPFNIPGFSFGPAISGSHANISGWIYNIPYRAVAPESMRSLYKSGIDACGAPAAPPAAAGSWLYNVPYRGNLAAKEFDVFGKNRNPTHLMRAAYKSGIACQLAAAK